MKDEGFEMRIELVHARTSAGGLQVHFHVPGHGRFAAELQDCAPKIRPSFRAGKPGMQHAHGHSSGCFQFVALEPLVKPDGLKQFFGRSRFFVAQCHRAAALTPDGVEIFVPRTHAPSFWREAGEVKARESSSSSINEDEEEDEGENDFILNAIARLVDCYGTEEILFADWCLVG